MAYKTKNKISKEKKRASFFKDWQRLTSDPNNQKTAVMEALADKYGVTVKTTYAWLNKIRTTN